MRTRVTLTAAAVLASGVRLGCQERLRASDRVASGRCRPEAPTDPYVLTLEHTVPQIRGSLRADRASASCARGPRGNAGRGH